MYKYPLPSGRIMLLAEAPTVPVPPDEIIALELLAEGIVAVSKGSPGQASYDIRDAQAWVERLLARGGRAVAERLHAICPAVYPNPDDYPEPLRVVNNSSYQIGDEEFAQIQDFADAIKPRYKFSSITILESGHLRLEGCPDLHPFHIADVLPKLQKIL